MKAYPHKGGAQLGRPIEVNGQIFYPAPLAARRCQVSLSRFDQWAKAAQTPNGWLLQVFQKLSDRRYYIEEKSLRRLEDRFLDDNTGRPVENVRIARSWSGTATKLDGDLYCSTGLAARKIGIHHQTVVHWLRLGKNPLGEPLRVIRDPISETRFFSVETVDRLRNARESYRRQTIVD